MQKHQETLDICDEILKIDSSAQQFFLRAYSLLELKRYDDAVEMCDKVLAKNGYDLFALCFKVDALYNLKKFKDAIKVSDQIKPWNEGEHIGEKAFFLDALIDKGRCLERLDRFKEAEKVFLDALKKSKNEVEPKNNALEALGHVNWIQGEHKKARKYFLQFTKEDRKKAIFIAKNSNKKKDEFKKSLVDTIIKDRTFSPEFINRFDEVLLYYPLNIHDTISIALLMLDGIVTEIAEKKGFNIRVEEDIVAEIVKRGYSVEFGAREMRRVIVDIIENYLADYLLQNKAKRGDTIKISLKEVKDYLKSKE